MSKHLELIAVETVIGRIYLGEDGKTLESEQHHQWTWYGRAQYGKDEWNLIHNPYSTVCRDVPREHYNFIDHHDLTALIRQADTVSVTMPVGTLDEPQSLGSLAITQWGLNDTECWDYIAHEDEVYPPTPAERKLNRTIHYGAIVAETPRKVMKLAYTGVDKTSIACTSKRDPDLNVQTETDVVFYGSCQKHPDGSMQNFVCDEAGCLSRGSDENTSKYNILSLQQLAVAVSLHDEVHVDLSRALNVFKDPLTVLSVLGLTQEKGWVIKENLAKREIKYIKEAQEP